MLLPETPEASACCYLLFTAPLPALSAPPCSILLLQLCSALDEVQQLQSTQQQQAVAAADMEVALQQLVWERDAAAAGQGKAEQELIEVAEYSNKMLRQVGAGVRGNLVRMFLYGASRSQLCSSKSAGGALVLLNLHCLFHHIRILRCFLQTGCVATRELGHACRLQVCWNTQKWTWVAFSDSRLPVMKV